MDSRKLLETLCAAHGVSGCEADAVAAARGVLEPLGACTVTPLGSLLCTIREPQPGKPHIMLDAHIDQIGMVVTGILEDGFVKVASCGGVDRRLLPASTVTIHGRQPVKGIVCSIPPHLQDSDSKKVDKIEGFSIDIGMSRQEAARQIRPGDRVTFDAPLRALLGGRVSCKSLDNRAGCAAVIRAGELLADSGTPCGVTVALTTMEEVGAQGAATAAYTVAPTHAVVVDVSFGHCPGVPKYRTAELGSGAMIGFAPILNSEMSEGLAQCAESYKIPYTREVMGGGTGTNADNIAVSRGGVRTALLSVPQRNMHTPVEIVSVSDIESVAQLIAAYIGGNF